MWEVCLAGVGRQGREPRGGRTQSGLSWRFHTVGAGWERGKKGKKGDPGCGPGIFKGLEVYKIMGFWGKHKRLFVAGAEGAW